MARESFDPIGRAIGKGAQKAYDSKVFAPSSNLADNEDLAKRASEQVQEFIKSIETNRGAWYDKLAVCYALWNGEPISRFMPSARSIHVPEPFKAVEAAVPRILEILIGQPDWFRVVGVDDAGKANAQAKQNLLKAQLRDDGFYRNFTDIIRAACIYGFAPAAVQWKFRRRTQKYNKVKETVKTDSAGNETGKDVTVEQATEEINTDGPSLRYVDVFDFGVDLRYPDHQDSPGVSVRFEKSEPEMLTLAKAGIYLHVDELINETSKERDDVVSGPPGTHMNPATFRQVRDASDGLRLGQDYESVASRQYEVYEFWGRFDMDPEDHVPGKDYKPEKEVVITLARKLTTAGERGSWHCLRIAENPYWHGMRPFVVAHYIRRAHCFQSVGMIEPIVRLSAELDDSRNMALAARSLAAKPIIIADDNADIMSSTLILDAGSVLRARSTDSIKPLFIPDRQDVAYQAEAQIKQDIRETTGIVSPLEGSSPAGSQTATELVTMVREANKKLAEVCRNVAECFLIPMLEMMDAMNQQCITEERLIQILGADGKTAELRKTGPRDVAGKVHFEIAALPQLEMAGIEARMLQGFANMALPWMPFLGNAMNPEPLLRTIFERQFGPGRIKDVFPHADRPQKPRTANMEHWLIANGTVILPQDGENYRAHLQGHLTFMESDTFRSWDEDAKRRMHAHVENTKEELARMVEQSVIPALPTQMGGMPGAPGASLPPQGPGSPPGAAVSAPGPSSMAGMTPTGQVRSNIAGIEPREKA